MTDVSTLSQEIQRSLRSLSQEMTDGSTLSQEIWRSLRSRGQEMFFARTARTHP